MAGKPRVPLIVFFTDFGYDGPYVGQMRIAVGRIAPMTAVVNLMHDAPRFDPRASAYLLAALAPRLPPTSICVGVVDPGVGSPRPGVIVEADGRFYVGPGNGLFEIVRRRAEDARVWILPEDAAASARSRSARPRRRSPSAKPPSTSYPARIGRTTCPKSSISTTTAMR
jgi:hypothetical protein